MRFPKNRENKTAKQSTIGVKFNIQNLFLNVRNPS